MQKHIIFSNIIDYTNDEWKRGAVEHLEANEIEVSEESIWEAVYDLLDDDYFIATEELDFSVNDEIVAIADIGRWNGRVTGYKLVGYNLRDCLTTECDYAEWYIDDYGNFKFTGHHHDGTNKVEYRMRKPAISDEQWERFLNLLYDGTITRRQVQHYTVRLGDAIADVYGWKLKGRKPEGVSA